MSFERIIMPSERPDRDTLTFMLASIGVNLAAAPATEANIEDTLLFASESGMQDCDLRTLSLLTQWLETHSRWVLVDRLVRMLKTVSDRRVRAYWKAVGQWLQRDRRFMRLAKLRIDKRVDLLSVGTDFHIDRHGEDERFKGTVLRVPAKTLRRRDADILSPVDLAARHRAYCWRVMMGPTYRADMWAALEDDSTLISAELARLTYGSFATAHQVRREWEIVNRGAS